jgi:hypothetical protein
MEFPAEYFIKLDGQDFLLGRLSVNKLNHAFWVEIDIVQKESKKIWAHVADLHGITELDEAIDKSVQTLADFVKKKSTT